VLVTAAAHPGLASGAITVTFRTWRRAQVKVGGHYRVGEATLLVDDVRQVRVGDITDDDAQKAGVAGRAELVARLSRRPRSRHGGSADPVDVTDDTLVWRVDFHRVTDGEPRLSDQADLDADDVAAIASRLDRLDAASADGPWTRRTLRLIAANPGVVSTTLAAEVGRERQAFKADVRKLKRLGLTESLEVGYRLSSRGEAWLATQPPSAGGVKEKR
jgi:hypothetical protein